MRLLFSVAPLLLLAACADAPPVVDLTAPSFDTKPVFRLNVAEVKVVDEYAPPFGGTHVEHLFPVSPARAVGIWTTDRLQAAGPRGTVEVHISDASVIENKGKEYDSYTANVTADMKLYDGVNTIVMAEAQASSHLTKNIDGQASIAARENLFAQMTRELSVALDRSLDEQIRQHFGSYIVSIQPRG